MILTAAATDVAAQHYLGVRGGFGGGTGSRFYPKYTEQTTLWGLYNAGVSWKYFTSQKYVGGTQADLLFMQQGYKEFSPLYSLGRYPGSYTPDGELIPGDSTGYYSRRVNSVVVPLMWQPHIYMFQRNLRVFLNLGVTFSYNISSTYELGSQENGIFDKGDYNFQLTRDNRWGYGLVGGGGLGYSFGRVEVLAEVRYYIGYSDLKKNWNKYWDSEEALNNRLRTPLDGLQASFGIYYRFGKKGILSAPSPRVEQKLREREEKKARRQGVVSGQFDAADGIPLDESPDDDTALPEEPEWDTEQPYTEPLEVPEDFPEDQDTGAEEAGTGIKS